MSAPRVLVVDDDIVNMSVLTKILRNKQFDTESAHDGREAMSMLLEDPEGFDVVLWTGSCPAWMT
jgi:CheY-like chemotaxis protein